jgi:hypothetical protein
MDLGIAVALPFAVFGTALGLILLANEVVHVGPFDRAVMGWTIMPLAWFAPVIAGAWWARLTAPAERAARTVTFVMLATVVAVLLSAITNRIGCEAASWVEVLPRMLVVGAVFGVGSVLAISLAAGATRSIEGWWTRGLAYLGCGVIGAATFFASLTVWAWVAVVGVSCAAPPPG